MCLMVVVVVVLVVVVPLCWLRSRIRTNALRCCYEVVEVQNYYN